MRSECRATSYAARCSTANGSTTRSRASAAPFGLSGFHHSLGRAGDHRLLSVEAPASGCVVVEAREPRVHANHLLHERFAHLPQVIDPLVAQPAGFEPRR